MWERRHIYRSADPQAPRTACEDAIVLGTHSAKGLEVFRDVQDKVECREIETRDRLHDAGDHQARLFSHEQIADMQKRAAGVGCPKFQREAEARLSDLLKKESFMTFRDIAIETFSRLSP